MKLMDAPWRRKAATAAFGFAVSFFQSPLQAQFYGGWGPYPFPMLPMPPPVIYPRAAQPGYQPIPPGTIRRMVANMGLRLVAAPRQKGHIYLADILRKPKTRRASVAGSCSTPIMEPWSKMFRSDTGQSQ